MVSSGRHPSRLLRSGPQRAPAGRLGRRVAWRQLAPVYRRRRLAVVLGGLALAALVHGAVAGAHANPQAARTVVVRPGDSLWALAGRYAPRQDPRRWVFRVERLNHLKGGQLLAGALLRLPAGTAGR